MSGRCFIDTNIFLYAHDVNFLEKRDSARQLITDEYSSGTVSISTQVLAEFFQVFAGKFKLPYVVALKEIHFMSRCRVIEQTLSLFFSGTALFKRYSLSFWDAMIVAAALEASADVLYTENLQHGMEIESLTIVDPFRNRASAGA